MSTRSPDDEYSEQETVRRREAGLKRLLATPPKPHKATEGAKKPKPPTKPR